MHAVPPIDTFSEVSGYRLLLVYRTHSRTAEKASYLFCFCRQLSRLRHESRALPSLCWRCSFRLRSRGVKSREGSSPLLRMTSIRRRSRGPMPLTLFSIQTETFFKGSQSSVPSETELMPVCNCFRLQLQPYVSDRVFRRSDVADEERSELSVPC